MEKLSVEELERTKRKRIRLKELKETKESKTQYHCLEKLPAFWR